MMGMGVRKDEVIPKIRLTQGGHQLKLCYFLFDWKPVEANSAWDSEWVLFLVRE